MQKIEINNHVYTVLEPSEMSTRRKLNLQKDIETMEWRMSPEKLDRFMDSIMADEKIEDVRRKILILQELRRLDVSYSPVINCTMNFILLDNEKNETIDSEFIAKKRLYCESDAEVNNFFLSNGITLLVGLGNLSNISKASVLLQEMKVAKAMEEIIWNQINRTFTHTLTVLE